MASGGSKLNKLEKEAFEQWQQKCKEIREATVVRGTESKEAKAQRIAKAKKDYAYFVTYYFPHYAKAPCAKFQIDAAKAILADANIFAILEWAREHAKSVHADILIPLWLKIHGELDGMVLVNKSETGAARLLGDVQAELENNQRYIDDYGTNYNIGNWMDGDFMCKDGTFFVALGRGQSPRGLRKGAKRPNYASVDDIDDEELVKNPKRVNEVVDWVLTALYGALNTKRGRMVIANNRIHRKSVLAHLVGDLEPGTPKREGIYHSKVCAIENGKPAWKENYTLEQLQAKFSKMGWIRSQREYFHNPIVVGKIFKNEWFQWRPMLPLDHYDAHVIYFDPSFKSSKQSDFKAIRHWGKTPREFHCLKSFCRQCTISEAVRWLYSYMEELYPNLRGCNYEVPSTIVDVYMEANFIQDILLDEFVAEGEIRGWQLGIRPDHRNKPDKYSRIESLTPFYERGMVYFNEAEKNNTDMITGNEQVLAIEPGSTTHDDAPDADEGAIYKLQLFRRQANTQRRIGTRPQRGY
ncbi:MAG: hypothetical protein RL660_446 [Bacteroidota bacterium]|jgi:phage terminase large subunit-like protein